MSILKHRPHAVEAPPERPRAVAARPLPPLPLGAPARAVEVLRDLRTADGAGMRRPSAPAPRRNPLAASLAAERALDRLSCVVGVYDCIAAELEAALAELAALAPFAAKAGC